MLFSLWEHTGMVVKLAPSLDPRLISCITTPGRSSLRTLSKRPLIHSRGSLLDHPLLLHLQHKWNDKDSAEWRTQTRSWCLFIKGKQKYKMLSGHFVCSCHIIGNSERHMLNDWKSWMFHFCSFWSYLRISNCIPFFYWMFIFSPTYKNFLAYEQLMSWHLKKPWI